MKAVRSFVLAWGFVAAALAARAEVVYEDSFDGFYGSINGKVPMLMSTTGATWKSPWWMSRNHSGEIMMSGAPSSGMALLPMPVLKGTETIRASVEVAVQGTSSNQEKTFFGLGFLPSEGGSLEAAGSPWVKLRGLASSGNDATAAGAFEVFGGPGATAPLAKQTAREIGFNTPPDTNLIELTVQLATGRLTAVVNGSTVFDGESKVSANQLKSFGFQMSFLQGGRNSNGVVKWVQLEVIQE